MIRKINSGRIITGILLLLIPFLWLGCTNNTLFESYQDFPQTGWHQNDPAVFIVTCSDTLQPYNLLFHIRHNVDYKYRNLWVFSEINYPEGTTTRDTIEFIIGDKEGNWLGKGIGKNKEDHILLSQNIRFPQAGVYQFSFSQAMREKDQVLENIQGVGLSIVKNR